jgi:hypothetical protein
MLSHGNNVDYNAPNGDVMRPLPVFLFLGPCPLFSLLPPEDLIFHLLYLHRSNVSSTVMTEALCFFETRSIQQDTQATVWAEMIAGGKFRRNSEVIRNVYPTRSHRFVPARPMEAYGSIAPLILLSALEGGEFSASRLGRFTSEERTNYGRWIGAWEGSRARMDAFKINLLYCWESKCGLYIE